MSTSPKIFFDESLPLFVGVIAEYLGPDALKQGLIVRDTSGRLRFLSSEASSSEKLRTAIEKKIPTVLGAYARMDGAISFSDDPGVQRLLKDSEILPMHEGPLRFKLLDRRIVGSTWLGMPQEETAKPPRIVFASLKGGVGRSTALAVAAADLARRSRNVLVIDLDLEAPGIGEMLLDKDRLPRFGIVDYLVENGLSGVHDRYLSEFIGTSQLTSAEGGRVDVIPVLGKSDIEHPSNTLPKLSRAVIEDIGADGKSVTMAAKIANMVRRFTERDPYDVIFIDSRAGLSEIAAPAVLGLGATVLLFGTAQRQTIQGYTSLFAALKLLAERDRMDGKRAEWRLFFKAVYAKASLNETIAERYRDDLYELFAENLYDEDVQQPDIDAISFDIDDPIAPHCPLVIPFTQNFVDFDPIQAPTQLNTAFYEQAFGPFLKGIDLIIDSASIPPSESEAE